MRRQSEPHTSVFRMSRGSWLVAAAAVAVIAGCAGQSTGPASARSSGQAASADDLFVVDCLLPGAVRKLGTSMTYLTPRRPIRTSAQDCEIRGGEYTSYDRASYATALKVWLPLAQAGDPVAQTYVGEIYEKGRGLTPDYELAATWYRKAAEAGNTRASINLGYLYEQGLGVQKDPVTAMNWYRRASGVSAGELEVVTAEDRARQAAAQEELGILRTDVARSKARESSLQAQLDQTQQDLDSRWQDLEKALRDLEELRKQLESSPGASAPLVPGAPTADAALRPEVADLERIELAAQLDSVQGERDLLAERLNAREQEAQTLRAEFNQSQKRLEQLRSTQSVTQRDLNQAQADLERLRREIDSEQIASSKAIDELTRTANQYEKVIDAQKTEFSTLQKEAAIQQTRLSRQLEQAQTTESRLTAELARSGDDIATLEGELARARAQGAAVERQAQESGRVSDRITSLEKQRIELEKELQSRRRLQESLDSELKLQRKETGDLLLSLERSESRLEEITGKQAATYDDLAAARNELAELRRAQASAADDREQIARLNKMLTHYEAVTAAQHTDLKRLESETRAQAASYSNQLQRSRTTAMTLRDETDQRALEIASLQRQLGVTQTQLALVEKQGRKQSAVDEAARKELQRRLAEREQFVEQQKAEIEQLEIEVQRMQVEMAGLESAPAELVDSGPQIEIIDPVIPVTRGMPTASLKTEMREVEILGKVLYADKLRTFRVNGVNTTVDDNGLFSYVVKVKDSENPVKVVAVDDLGRRSSFEFLLLSATPSTGGQKLAGSSGASAAGAGSVDFGNYYALVIGNNRYANMPNLGSAVNDAGAVSELLDSKYGFRSTLLVNANRYEILSALNDLRAQLTERDNLLIYYAGHGELDRANARGYWLPVDAEPTSTANWISNLDITDILEVVSAKHILVVADSCYAGTMARSALSQLQAGMTDEKRVKWLRVMSRTPSRTVITSGGERPVLDAGTGDHSVFANAFLKVLSGNHNVVDAHSVYLQVANRVKGISETLRHEQDPQYAPLKFAGHEAGVFLFVPSGLAMHTPDDNEGAPPLRLALANAAPVFEWRTLHAAAQAIEWPLLTH